MKFQIGDIVREGSHVGTVTDVGTVLVQVKTDEGTSRVVCPWELVRIRVPHDGDGVPLATGATASNDSTNSCGVMFMDSHPCGCAARRG